MHNLTHNQQLLDALFEQAHDGFFFMMLDEPVRWDDTVDKDAILAYAYDHHRMTHVNNAILKQFDMTREEFIGRTPRQFFDGKYELYKQRWTRLFTSGKERWETIFKQADGSIRWFDGEYSCVYDDDGRITGHFAIRRDVTDAKEAQLQLEASEFRYRMLFEKTKDAVTLLDMNMKCIKANDRVVELFGYEIDELLTMSVNEMVVPDEFSDSQNVLEKLLADEPVPFYERRFRRKDGSIVRAEVNVALIRDANGEPLYIQSIIRDITERTKIEERLRLQGLALNASANAIMILNADGTIEWSNPAFSKLTGFEADEVHGKHPIELMRSGHHDLAYYQNFDDTISAGEVWQGRLVNRRKDGTFYTEEQTMTPVKNEKGKITHYISVKQDVSDRIAMEQALRESEARYRSLVDALSEGIVLHGSDGAIQTCNEAAERILGLTKDQMMGLTSVDPRWRSIRGDGSPFPGEEHPAMITLHTGEAQENIIMGVHKPSGELTWILVNSQPIFGDDEKQPIAVAASFADITEQRIAEEALREKHKELEEFFDLVLDLMMISEMDSNMLTVNKAWEQTLGYPLSALIGNEYVELSHPDDIDDMRQALVELGQGKSLRNFVHRLRHQDGSYRYVQWNAHPSEGKIYAVGRDITEQRHTEAQAFDLALQKERVNILASFIQDASHEFRTPLAVINTNIYMHRRLDDPQRKEAKLIQIEKQVGRLSKLVDMLATLSKLDSAVQLELQPVNINQLIQQIWVNYDELIVEKELDVEIILEDLPNTLADIKMFNQALRHLIDNAIRFTPTKGCVEIHTSQDDESIRIDVWNSGDGIAPDILPDIFTRFVRSDTAHSTPGFGLGLTIVEKVIQGHSGLVRVTNAPEGGTLARITLPLPE